MKYVILENDLPIKLISAKGFVPENSMPAPDATRSHLEISIVEIDDGFGNLSKQAILDPVKVASFDALLLQEEADRDAEVVAKQARKDKAAALRSADLNSIPQLKQAIIEILDYLELN